MCSDGGEEKRGNARAVIEALSWSVTAGEMWERMRASLSLHWVAIRSEGLRALSAYDELEARGGDTIRLSSMCVYVLVAMLR